MISTVRPRPNYYEMLGLATTASVEEIKQAYARSIGLFQRPLIDTAELAVAFETLRDPVRRRDYDIITGLRPRPEAAPKKMPEVHFSLQFIGSGAPKADPVPQRIEGPEPQVDAETLVDRSVGSLIATSLREPPKAAEPTPAPKPAADEIPAFLRTSLNRRTPIVEESTFEWQRPAVTLGAVLLAVGVLAGVAGWSAGLVDERDQVGAGMTVDVPKAKPRPASATALASAVPEQAVAEPYRSAPAAAVARTRHAAPAKREPLSESDLFANAAVDQASQAATEIADTTTDAAPPVQAQAASLPLPKTVIARTIGRIGYACGEVASTAPVEGASGVFKITCTSGQSYQATPVRGRYHFRRLSDR
jgi:hypothetical protein